MRDNTPIEGSQPSDTYSYQSTINLLNDSTGIQSQPDGGLCLAQSDGSLTPLADLDIDAVKHSRKGQDQLQTVVDSEKKIPATMKRKNTQQAFAYLNRARRRDAIDTSPNAHYFPPDYVANSLRHRKDKKKAVDVLQRIHQTDRSASMNIIARGFPNDLESYHSWLGRNNKGKDGDKKAPKALARIHNHMLLLKFSKSNGMPSKTQQARDIKTLRNISDPNIRASEMLNMLYSDADYARGDRSGNRAFVALYSNALDRDTAQSLLSVERKNLSKAHSKYVDQEKFTSFFAGVHMLYAV